MKSVFYYFLIVGWTVNGLQMDLKVLQFQKQLKDRTDAIIAATKQNPAFQSSPRNTTAEDPMEDLLAILAETLKLRAMSVNPLIDALYFANATRCAQAFEEYYSNIDLFSEWALKMADSSAQVLPEGWIMEGNPWNYGIQSECFDAAKDYPAKYCVAYDAPTWIAGGQAMKEFQKRLNRLGGSQNILLSPWISALGMTLFRGVCIPDFCSEYDMAAGWYITNRIILNVPIDTVLIEGTCTSNQFQEIAEDTSEIMFLVVVGSVIFFVLVATVADMIRQKLGPSDSSTTPSMGFRALQAFSLCNNFPKLFSVNRNPSSIDCLHGIRVLSMVWVIYGHAYDFLREVSVTNPGLIIEYFNQTMMQLMWSATLSTDSFFFLSGFLVAYLLLKELDKNGGRFNIPLYYIHRWLRLTPVYMMTIWFIASFYLRMDNGPFWGIQREPIVQPCRDEWYQNMFYYQNFDIESKDQDNLDPQCHGVGWYLAVDMQLYVVAPLFIVPLYYLSEGIGLAFISVVALSGSIVRLILFYVNDGWLGFTTWHETDNAKRIDEVYMKPWGRYGVYATGILTAYLLKIVKKHRFQMPVLLALIGWIVALGLMLLMIFFPAPWMEIGGDQMPEDMARFYGAFYRNIWALGLGWIVIACHLGRGGIINTILSWTMFFPLSRLVYTMYLSHPIVLWWIEFSQKEAQERSHGIFFEKFAAAWFITLLVSIPLSLCFEAPVMNLEKLIFPKRGATRQTNNPEIESADRANGGVHSTGNLHNDGEWARENGGVDTEQTSMENTGSQKTIITLENGQDGGQKNGPISTSPPAPR